MKKKIIFLNEGQYRLLFENDNEKYIQEIKNLINSGQIENIETALEMGKWLKAEGIFDVEQCLKDKYQFLIDFLANYSLNYDRDKNIKDKPFSKQIEHILNLDSVIFNRDDNDLEFSIEIKEKIKGLLPKNTRLGFAAPNKPISFNY